MEERRGDARGMMVLLWALLALYAAGRICQQYPDRIPLLLIVVLQVVPPGLFALLHGSLRYGVRGMAAFTACCLGVGAISESLSLRTGFPFGHYFFTDVMGPKVMQLPVLLVLAYLGIGYCSWMLAVLLLGYRERSIQGFGLAGVPLLAGLVMVTWDLSMEAIWSTLDRAWIWRDGGPYFGVPISNFIGWYLTAFLFYLIFAFSCRVSSRRDQRLGTGYWRMAAACYGICGLGNLLIYRDGLFPASAMDAAGRVWMAHDILLASTLVSVLGMGTIAMLAWRRSRAVQDRVVARTLTRT